MADIFREVDEDVRRDEANRLWERYQGLVLAVAAVIVLATGGWRAYDYWRTQKAEKAAAQYEAALIQARDGKSDEAAAALKGLTGADAPQGYRTLAALRLAAETGRKDPAAGTKAYDAIGQDAAVPPLLQSAAKLRAAMLRLDEADAKEIASRLEPLAAAGAPFRHSAREMLGLAALKANDLDAAGRWLDQLVIDADAPAPVRERAEALLGLVRAGKPAAK